VYRVTATAINMILCFECPEDKKRHLDELISRGAYRDYSEFLGVAVANQLLLEARGRTETGFVLSAVPPDCSGESGRRDTFEAQDRPSGGIPDLFLLSPLISSTPTRYARAPDDVFARGQFVPVERWIFGQYNRLLPAKSSCRALANLQMSRDFALDVTSTAAEIARAARDLGVFLQQRDRNREIDRDDRISTAFPLPANEERALSRFANHFVASINSRGQLSGLLTSLKLIGRSETKKSKILLTETGWQFALLKNVCIDDDGGRAPGERLSRDERTFLTTHIRDNVPQESSAFQTIIQLIEAGHATPEKLDKELEDKVSKGFIASRSFVSTQRTGAISRMTDLGLVIRHRDATRVNYSISQEGRSFVV
jgi:Arc/MetJ-type ribon-helix-helix transcriptional regulator